MKKVIGEARRGVGRSALWTAVGAYAASKASEPCACWGWKDAAVIAAFAALAWMTRQKTQE